MKGRGNGKERDAEKTEKKDRKSVRVESIRKTRRKKSRQTYAFVVYEAADTERPAVSSVLSPFPPLPLSLPVQIVIARDFGTIYGKFRIYAPILFLALTGRNIWRNGRALFATNRRGAARPDVESYSRVNDVKAIFLRGKFRGRIGA